MNTGSRPASLQFIEMRAGELFLLHAASLAQNAVRDLVEHAVLTEG